MRFGVFLVAMACAIACASSTTSSAEDDAFTSASLESGVPRDLLVAIARVEGGLTMPKTRDVDLASQVPVAGPLELRRGKLDTLARGAALLGVSEIDIRRDADLGLRAGAKVLAELGATSHARGGDLATWQNALEQMSGYADAAHARKYAQRVFATLAVGGTFSARDGGSITLAPHAELTRAASAIDLTTPTETMGTLPEYPGAEVFLTSCTNKCDTDRGGNAIQYVVIHDTEGGWDASVATLQNDSGKSVTYIVDTDGTVGQFVPESYTAWHDGNYFYNQRSVGIEHVGYFTQTYPDAEYASSAKLVAYLTQKYSIAKDREHIFGHDQVPNGNVMAESSPVCESSPATCETGTDYGGADNHRDPGDWEWCTYMPRFGGTCKCDDIWSLWNCSSDKTQAFRCVNGQVELEQCTAGCTVEALGVDDECEVAPDAGTSTQTGSKFAAVPAQDNAAPANASASGCNLASSSARASDLTALVGALALALARRRRR